MKKLVLVLMLLGSLTLNAHSKSCPFESVHCAHFTGLSKELKDGRYIKIANAKGEFVICFTEFSTVAILQDNARRYLGDNVDTYSICHDRAGKKCEELATDKFTISFTGENYFSTPQFFNVDVTNQKDKYTACNVTG